jgi:phosphoglycolate phosphatase
MLIKNRGNNMKYKLIIFDFDGTLADTFPWFLSSLDIVADKYNLSRIDRNQKEELRKLDARSFLKHLKIPFYKLPQIAKYMRDLMTEQIEQISLYAGSEKLLRDLKAKGYKIAVVSSNSQVNISKVMGKDLIKLIDHFVGGVSMFGKESKLKEVLKLSGVVKEDAIYIGDELRDVQASQKISLPVGAVGWGYNAAEALKALNPTIMFNSLEEILDKV